MEAERKFVVFGERDGFWFEQFIFVGPGALEKFILSSQHSFRATLAESWLLHLIAPYCINEQPFADLDGFVQALSCGPRRNFRA